MEQGNNILYRDYIRIVFPDALLRPGKVCVQFLSVQQMDASHRANV